MPEQKTIVLVHGFWGGASHWSKVILELKRLGYTNVQAVENPLTSLKDDADRTRKMVAQIKGPVVLVGHSYGGEVITEMGDMPNVTALVYIAAFAPDAGESAGAISQAHPPAAFSSIAPDSDGYLWIDRAKFHDSFCQDLDADEAYVMAATQKAPIGGTFGDAVTAPAWKAKPCWYQISSSDRMIHPDNQIRMAARMKPKGQITLDASHASLASHPGEVAALIDQAARA